MLKLHPLGRQLVDIRGAEVFLSPTTQITTANVIGIDDENVWLGSLRHRGADDVTWRLCLNKQARQQNGSVKRFPVHRAGRFPVTLVNDSLRAISLPSASTHNPLRRPYRSPVLSHKIVRL